jgi:uncharacterized protein (DUF924 family)
MEAAFKANPEDLQAFALKSPRHSLGLTILLDQISRNLNRGDESVKVFTEYDPLALKIAKLAIQMDHDLSTSDSMQRMFFYLPLMHSENIANQDMGLEKFEAMNKESGKRIDQMSLGFARAHRDEIKTFGRFPHRNQAMGRKSTPEELEHLGKGGGFGQ